MVVNRIASLSLLFFLLIYHHGQGQTTYTFRVKSNLTKKGVDSVGVYHNDKLVGLTNHLGYIQVNKSPGDALIIEHPDYSPQQIVLPEATSFSIFLEIKKHSLVYTGGIAQFYRHIQRNLKYPTSGKSKNDVYNVYAKIIVQDDGSSHLVLDDEPGAKNFNASVEDAFKKLPGNWSPDYGGLTFILPVYFQIDGQNPIPEDKSKLQAADYVLSVVTVRSHTQWKR